MKTARTLFTAAMFASAVFGQVGDPGAEERFRMKFGRNSAREELRQKQAQAKKTKETTDCAETGCCRRQHEKAEAGHGSQPHAAH